MSILPKLRLTQKSGSVGGMSYDNCMKKGGLEGKEVLFVLGVEVFMDFGAEGSWFTWSQMFVDGVEKPRSCGASGRSCTGEFRKK
jgi:hypothetical protein